MVRSRGVSVLRRSVMFCVVLICCVGASNASAASVEPMIKIHGGAVFPAMPPEFPDNWNPGANMGGGIGALIAGSATVDVGLYATLDFSRAMAVEERVLVDIDLYTGFANVATYLKINSKIHPYIVAGAGYLKMAAGEVEETAVALHGSVGFATDVGQNTRFLLEFDYVYGNTDGEATGFVHIRAGFII